MKRRRILILSSAMLVVVAAAAVWATMATGSSLQAKPVPAGENSVTTGSRVQAGDRSSFKCKSRACVNWGYTPFGVWNTFQIFGSFNVLSVTHTGSATYCVQFAPKVKVNPDTIALATPDWTDSLNIYIIIDQVYAYTGWTPCPLPGSIKFYTFDAAGGGGGGTSHDEGANISIP